jgi:hypothetical protein
MINVYGQSVGSCPSCYLASTKPVGGIYVYICLYTSLFAQVYVWIFFVWHVCILAVF